MTLWSRRRQRNRRKREVGDNKEQEKRRNRRRNLGDKEEHETRRNKRKRDPETEGGTETEGREERRNRGSKWNEQCPGKSEI